MPELGVYGDPDGMRRLAAALHKDIAQLKTGKSKVKRAFEDHGAQGPIAHSWERNLDPALADLSAAASRLGAMADKLSAGAAQVERDLARARSDEAARLAREAAQREAR